MDFGRNYFYWKEDLSIVNFHNGLLYIRIVVDGYALKKFKTKTTKLDNIRGKTELMLTPDYQNSEFIELLPERDNSARAQ